MEMERAYGGNHKGDEREVIISEKMRFKTVILDFDGTLVESVGIKDRAFEELFKDYPEHLDEIMSYHLAHNATVRFDKFIHITEKILARPYNKEMKKDLGERFSKAVFKGIVECPYVRGAEDFLNYFYDKIPLYLLSASPAQELDEIIKRRDLTKYFKKVYAIPWVKKDAIQDIVGRENLSSSQVVFIGDTAEDYQAAKETEAFFIGRDSKKSFNAADITIYKDFTEISRFLHNEIF